MGLRAIVSVAEQRERWSRNESEWVSERLNRFQENLIPSIKIATFWGSGLKMERDVGVLVRNGNIFKCQCLFESETMYDIIRVREQRMYFNNQKK